MRRQVRGRFHDDRDAGLVVRSQQGCAIGGHERLALHVGQFGIVGHANDLARIARQDDILPVIIAVDDGLDVLPGRIRRRIEMGDPGDGRPLPIAGNRGQDDAVLIDGGVANAHLQKFVDQQSAEFELSRRTRITLGGFVGLGVDANVTAEALK